jgi:hypothetical protein
MPKRDLLDASIRVDYTPKKGPAKEMILMNYRGLTLFMGDVTIRYIVILRYRYIKKI